MKTTIKLTPYKRFVVAPDRAGNIQIEIIHGIAGGVTTTEVHVLKPDQAGVLMFAIEQAALAPWPQFDMPTKKQKRFDKMLEQTAPMMRDLMA